MFVADDGRLQ